MSRKACFLDRDGVLIEERGYLSDPDGVRLCPGVPEALALMRGRGYFLVLVSNQSGIARGYFTPADLHAVEARLDELLLARGVSLDAKYYCFHHKKGIVPEYAVDCDCRKPAPGLLLRAAREHDLDLAASVMVGDKTGDLEAAYRAGCRAAALVRTGHGAEQDLTPYPDAVDAPDLLTAARLLLARESISHLLKESQ